MKINLKALRQIAQQEGFRPTVRDVCGKPHRTEARAKRGATMASNWGWEDVQVEPRQGGEYFVVTGVRPMLKEAFPELNEQASSPKVQGRYRWPSK
jgi:hypothetical protein